jgi:tRNA(Ile)-lysidine synthase
MDLLQSFLDFIAKEKLFSPGDQLLIAVSGGLDSVVLCELCHRAGYVFSMAHGNFQLRGEESERDEQFVRGLAVKYGSELFVRRFDTQEYAADQKVSVQVAARELRYAWFREIAGRLGSAGAKVAVSPPALILTAHHLDDNIETLLMNFFKGTGIAGLHGILPRQGGLVRPLLFTGKEELERFAREQQLDWVEDSSNRSDKYTRNYFRHEVIPLVERVYPGALENIGANIPRFREIEALYRQSVDRHKSKLMERRGGEIHIPVLKLKKTEPLHTVVYEIIHEFGFSPRQVDEVLRLLDSGSGKYLLSGTHRVLKNRNWLIISPLGSVAAVNILIESAEDRVSYEGGELSLKLAAVKEFPGTPHIACLDAADIRFPLLLRKWKQGDYFYPLGMRKKKKLGRFFIDNKLSRTDKEKVWVIEMDKKIIWVVGHRVDDRYRITAGTRSMLIIEMRLA